MKNINRFLLFYLATFSPLAWGLDEKSDIVQTATLEVGSFSEYDRTNSWIEGEIESFRQSHPDIQVETIGLYRPKRGWRSIESLPGVAKHVIGIEAEWGGEVPYLIRNEMIVPIEDFLPDEDFKIDFVPSNLWEPVKFAGKHWGVPWNVDFMVLAIRKNFWDAAGITEPPKTWEELIDLIGVMKEVDLERSQQGRFEYEQVGFALHDPDMLPIVWCSMMLQEGGNVFEDSRLVLDSSEALRTYDVLHEIINHPGTRYDLPGESVNPFIAMAIVSPYEMMRLSDVADYRFFLVPTSGREVTLDHGGRYLAVRRSDPEHEKLAWRFVKHLCLRGKRIPSDISLTPEQKELLESNPVLPIRSDLLYKSNLITHQDFGNIMDSFSWLHFSDPHVTGRLKAFVKFKKTLPHALEGRTNFQTAVNQIHEFSNRQELERPKEVHVNLFPLYLKEQK